MGIKVVVDKPLVKVKYVREMSEMEFQSLSKNMGGLADYLAELQLYTRKEIPADLTQEEVSIDEVGKKKKLYVMQEKDNCYHLSKYPINGKEFTQVGFFSLNGSWRFAGCTSDLEAVKQALNADCKVWECDTIEDVIALFTKLKHPDKILVNLVHFTMLVDDSSSCPSDFDIEGFEDCGKSCEDCRRMAFGLKVQE